MTFDLGHLKDQRATDTLLEGVLKAHAANEVSLEQARYLLSHIIILAGKGDERLVRDWLAPLRLAQWLQKCHAALSCQKVSG